MVKSKITDAEKFSETAGVKYNDGETEATRIGVAWRTLWGLCQNGFPHIKVGNQYRFDPARTDEHLAQQDSMKGVGK